LFVTTIGDVSPIFLESSPLCFFPVLPYVSLCFTMGPSRVFLFPHTLTFYPVHVCFFCFLSWLVAHPISFLSPRSLRPHLLPPNFTSSQPPTVPSGPMKSFYRAFPSSYMFPERRPPTSFSPFCFSPNTAAGKAPFLPENPSHPCLFLSFLFWFPWLKPSIIASFSGFCFVGPPPLARLSDWGRHFSNFLVVTNLLLDSCKNLTLPSPPFPCTLRWTQEDQTPFHRRLSFSLHFLSVCFFLSNYFPCFFIFSPELPCTKVQIDPLIQCFQSFFFHNPLLIPTYRYFSISMIVPFKKLTFIYF